MCRGCPKGVPCGGAGDCLKAARLARPPVALMVRGLWAGALLSAAAAPVSALTGNLSAHDPSTLIKDGSTFHYYSTGNGITHHTSTNLTNFSSATRVFSAVPTWTGAFNGNSQSLWAPEITFSNGQYRLYYAASTFGSQTSAIGLATNPTLNASSPNFNWTDQGVVVQSGPGSNYNAIDPSVFQDTNGSLYMSFGSFWNGIFMTQLDPTTGKLLAGAPMKNVARNSASGDPIEASYLYRRGIYYYLFANWGLCCQGVNSTYNIRVGRATSPMGPFLDQNGVDMVNGGGTLFLGSEGRYIGPGQIGITVDGTHEYFGFHFYDGNNGGAATYDLRPLFWSAGGWPLAVPEPATAAMVLLGGLGVFGRRPKR